MAEAVLIKRGCHLHRAILSRGHIITAVQVDVETVRLVDLGKTGDLLAIPAGLPLGSFGALSTLGSDSA